MTTKYETMERANHPTYIQASAALKQAQGARTIAGARRRAVRYLLSRYLFAPLRGPAAREATRERIADARATLPAAQDHRIAELFVQFADEGSRRRQRRPSPRRRRGTSRTSLPAYLRRARARAPARHVDGERARSR